MSIWSSVGSGEGLVRIVMDESDAAWYRGEAETGGAFDVATTWHRLIRLSLWADEGPREAEVLIDPDNARLLATRLLLAADLAENAVER